MFRPHREQDADRFAQEIDQQSTGDRNSHSAFGSTAPEEVDKISENLHGNESYGKSPSPPATAKQADSGECQRRGEQRKTDACRFSEGHEFPISEGIE